MYKTETGDFYKDISGDVATKFDTINFPRGLESGIPVGCNKKLLGMFQEKLVRKL